MSEQQLKDYVKNKYGELWQFSSSLRGKKFTYDGTEYEIYIPRRNNSFRNEIRKTKQEKISTKKSSVKKVGKNDQKKSPVFQKCNPCEDTKKIIAFFEEIKKNLEDDF